MRKRSSASATEKRPALALRKSQHETASISLLVRLVQQHSRELDAVRDEQQIQFKRLSQLQAEFDLIRGRHGV